MPPSPPAGDAAFLRRVSLDLTGEQPTPEEVRRFLADTDPDKRVKLVDRLLARPEFVAFWRIKLGDLLQISTARQGNGAYRYQAWIDDCSGQEPALGRGRPDAADRRGRPDRHRERRAGQLRDGRARAQRPGRADRPAVPRPSDALRPVPRPPVRRLDAGRLLRPGRLLRQGPARRRRRRGDDGPRRRSRSIPRARSSTCGPRSRSSRGCSTARPSRSPPRRIRARRWPTG